MTPAPPYRLVTVVGARPQLIKAAATSRALRTHFSHKVEELLLHTGQHYDAEMSGTFFDELELPEPHVQLEPGGTSHGEQTARMVLGVEKALLDLHPHAVLLFGDTNSTLAGALAAAKLNIPIAHVEAGLRSFDKTMPEEVNRIACDHMSTWLFCPTPAAMTNLAREGFRPLAPDTFPTANRPRVELVGDVMYDNALHFAPKASDRILTSLGIGHAPYALVTIHRGANTDAPERLNALFRALLEVNERLGLAIVLPAHPRLVQRMQSLLRTDLQERLGKAQGFHMLRPTGYLDMVALQRNSTLVITDSGGLQKEAYFHQKPCVVLRSTTEWVELVQSGHSTLADADGELVLSATERYLKSSVPERTNLWGAGDAAERIGALVVKDLDARHGTEGNR
jgi:UDP-GlcNAc3NAcA epimerase